MSKRDWVTWLAQAAEGAQRKAGRAEQRGDQNSKLWREVAAARGATAKSLQANAERSRGTAAAFCKERAARR